MNYAKVYEKILKIHAFLPYHFGGGRALPPFRVQLDLTYRCNLRCSFCYQDALYKKGGGELGTEEVLEVLGQTPPFSLINLIGGEPLLRKDFLEIAGWTLPRRKVNLVTNGTLLTEEVGRFLVDRGLLLIGVSIDGIGRTHDQIRGTKGAYRRIVSNLEDLKRYKELKKKKFPLLDIKTVATAPNLGQLGKIYDLALSLGADFFTLSLPKVSEGQFNPKLSSSLGALTKRMDFSLLNELDFSALRRILRKLFAKEGQTKIRLYPEFSVETLGREVYNLRSLLRFFLPCAEPWSALQVTAAGDVYPCLSLKMGSLREESLGEIWNGEKFRGFRKELKKAELLPACLGCCYLRQR